MTFVWGQAGWRKALREENTRRFSRGVVRDGKNGEIPVGERTIFGEYS